MQKRILDIIAVLMAVVVLLSTMTFTLSTHYCGNVLVDTAIFKAAKDCGMKMESSSINSFAITQESCCLDKQLIVEGQDVIKIVLEAVEINKKTFVSGLSLKATFKIERRKSPKFNLRKYIPPSIVKPIHQLDEVYLI
ncbi:hypothetical protein OA501_02855 [Flavobacteriaceae bacterium]|nr:hypothetical protein [Flavobacteriaceae bacterium]